MVRPSCRLAALTVCLCAAAPAWAANTGDDGLRAVTAERYGIAVRVPQAWKLTGWNQNARAFELSLPQEGRGSLGRVTCDLSVAPESLAEYQKQHEEADGAARIADDKRPENAERRQFFQRSSFVRKLLQNKLESLSAERYGEQRAEKLKQRLATTWSYESAEGGVWREMRVALVSEGHLYTFTLTSDEAHFDAYQLDFEDMLARAEFTPPATGVESVAGGYWLQTEFRFALWLPAGWKPALGPNNRIVFFAAAAPHDGVSACVQVAAGLPEPLDMKALKEKLPGDIVKLDPHAKVASCEVIPLGDITALETVIHTRQGDADVTIIDRRFKSQRCRYEVRIACLTSAYEKLRPDLLKSLDSFREVREKAGADLL